MKYNQAYFLDTFISLSNSTGVGAFLRGGEGDFGLEFFRISIKGERIYQDYFGDFLLRVIMRFISHLETILKTIFPENNCQIENSLQNSLQTENKPWNNLLSK